MIQRYVVFDVLGYAFAPLGRHGAQVTHAKSRVDVQLAKTLVVDDGAQGRIGGIRLEEVLHRQHRRTLVFCQLALVSEQELLEFVFQQLILALEVRDQAEDFLQDPDYLFMFISYNLNKASEEGTEKLAELGEACYNNGVSIIGLSASDQESVDQFRHDHQLIFDFYATDEITLKTMIRSNPGLMLLKKGTVIAKWHHNDTPTWEEVQEILSSKS